MDTTNVDESNESPDVRLSIMGIENDKEKPEVTTGDYAEAGVILEFEEQEGKKVFPTKVVMKDDKTVVVMYKQNGEVKTITLDEYAAKQLVKNRKIKANPVASVKKSSRSKGETR